MVADTFKGWKFGEWLKHNKSNIRLIVSAALGIGVSYVSSFEGPYALMLGTFVTGFSKLLLDTLDYYLSN